MLQPIQIAKYFIYLNNEMSKKIQNEDGVFANATTQADNITHLKMQKLVFYANVLSLVYNDKPLFDEDIIAKQHGPVIPSLYEHLKQYSNQDLMNVKELQTQMIDINKEDEEICFVTFKEYGIFTASRLRNMTHEEEPWIIAIKKGKNTIITQESIKDFYKRQRKQKADEMYRQSESYRCLFK